MSIFYRLSQNNMDGSKMFGKWYGRAVHLNTIDLADIAKQIQANTTAKEADVKGFCASVPVSRVAELDYVLTPGRYVGLPEEEDDFNFAERFTALKAEFEEQLKEEERLNKVILENLGKIKLD